MKPEIKKALAGVRQALARFEKAEGRIAIRNARRALFGATQALRLRVDKAYPIPARKESPRAKTLLFVAGHAAEKWFVKQLEEEIRRRGYTWNLLEAQSWVNMQLTPSCGVAPLIPVSDRYPLPCVGGLRYRHSHGPIDMDFPAELDDAQRLSWILHRMVHVERIAKVSHVKSVHGAPFQVRMVELYQSFGAQAWREAMEFEGGTGSGVNRNEEDEEDDNQEEESARDDQSEGQDEEAEGQ